MESICNFIAVNITVNKHHLNVQYLFNQTLSDTFCHIYQLTKYLLMQWI